VRTSADVCGPFATISKTLWYPSNDENFKQQYYYSLISSRFLTFSVSISSVSVLEAMHSKVKMRVYPIQNNVASAVHCIKKECKKWKPSIHRIVEESKEQDLYYLPGRQLTLLEAHSKNLKIELFLALGMHGPPSKWDESIVRFFSGAFRAVGEVCHQLGSIHQALTYIGASFELKKWSVAFSARQGESMFESNQSL
jgi:hypothetical protein